MFGTNVRMYYNFWTIIMGVLKSWRVLKTRIFNFMFVLSWQFSRFGAAGKTGEYSTSAFMNIHLIKWGRDNRELCAESGRTLFLRFSVHTYNHHYVPSFPNTVKFVHIPIKHVYCKKNVGSMAKNFRRTYTYSWFIISP